MLVSKAVYEYINCVNQKTGDVELLPFFIGYVMKDGNIYDIQSTVKKMGSGFGVTKAMYFLLSEDGKNTEVHVIPIIKSLKTGLPIYNTAMMEYEFEDQELREAFYESLYEAIEKVECDNVTWNVATGESIVEETKTKKKVEKSAQVQEQKAESKVEERTEPEVVAIESTVKDDTVNDNTVQEDTVQKEEKTKQLAQGILDEFNSPVQEESASKETTSEEYEAKEESEEDSQKHLEECKGILEDIMEVSSVKKLEDGDIDKTETDSDFDLGDITGEQYIEETAAEEVHESQEEDCEEEISQDEENILSRTVKEEKEDVFAEDKVITTLSEDDIQQQYLSFKNGNKINFIPRVMVHKETLHLSEEDICDLYYLVKNGINVFDYEKSKIDAIRLHFGKCKYPIKVIFDAFTLEEVLGMLHVEVLDESPTDLYDGIFKALFIYKTYLDLMGQNSQTTYHYLVIKMTYLSSMTQTAVIAESDAFDEDDEGSGDEKEGKIKLINDLLSESNSNFRTYIADEVLDHRYYGENGEELKGYDFIRYLCQLGYENKLLPINDNMFTKVADLKNLSIQINPTSILMYSGAIEICPNVVGQLYNIYLKNINKYAESNALIDCVVEEIPLSILADGINYNSTLDDLKTSDDFKDITKMTTYSYISKVENKVLKIKHAILPLVRGKVIGKVIGFICTDINDIDVNRKYFIPITGSFLGQLKELKVAFVEEVKLNCKEKDGVPLYAIIADKNFLTSNNIAAKTVHMEFDGSFNLNKLSNSLNRTTEFSGTVVPDFIKNTEETVLYGYKLMGLYNPII